MIYSKLSEKMNYTKFDQDLSLENLQHQPYMMIIFILGILKAICIELMLLQEKLLAFNKLN